MKKVITVAARLRSEDVALILNCQKEDIAVLVAKKLLKPLGNPANNATKYFSRSDLMEQINQEGWLARVTNALYQASRTKNENRRKILEFNQREVA